MIRVRLFADPRGLARALASDLARALAARPHLVFGLPAGRTPLPLYDELVRLEHAGRLDLSRTVTFNLDDFAGIPVTHPGSFRTFMNRHLFDRLRRPPRRIYSPNGAARNRTDECQRYERAIRREAGIDVLLLGLGTNGHIGFNEPGDALMALTHTARLTDATRRANASLFEQSGRTVPREGLSMGMATLLAARRIVLLATGTSKSRAAAQLVAGPVTTRLPASFLQLHPNAEVWLDRLAAVRLRGGVVER